MKLIPDPGKSPRWKRVRLLRASQGPDAAKPIETRTELQAALVDSTGKAQLEAKLAEATAAMVNDAALVGASPTTTATTPEGGSSASAERGRTANKRGGASEGAKDKDKKVIRVRGKDDEHMSPNEDN